MYKFVVAVVLSTCFACSAVPHTGYAVPAAGEKSCHSDSDCPANYYCGFAHVDSYPVCRYSPGANDLASY